MEQQTPILPKSRLKASEGQKRAIFPSLIWGEGGGLGFPFILSKILGSWLIRIKFRSPAQVETRAQAILFKTVKSVPWFIEIQRLKNKITVSVLYCKLNVLVLKVEGFKNKVQENPYAILTKLDGSFCRDVGFLLVRISPAVGKVVQRIQITFAIAL